MASGNSSISIGNSNTASGYSSLAMGLWTTAGGDNSTELGSNTKARGNNSTALGLYTFSNSYACTVIGRGNDTTNMNSINAWVPQEPLFVIGNGWLGSLSNVFTVLKNGNVGIGITSPGTKLAIAGLTGSATGSTLIINGNNVYYLASKKESKKDIEPLTDNFDKILKAQPVSFIDKATGMRGIGYIAEEFEKEGLQNLLVYENGNLLSLRYDLISVYNLEIIKEQQQQIEFQQKEIDELKTLVNTLVANQTGQGNK